MKKSEARIIKYLQQVDDRHKYAKAMSYKLDIDYGYVLRILGLLKFKEYVRTVRRDNKIFYRLTESAPTEEAEKRLSTIHTNKTNEE